MLILLVLLPMLLNAQTTNRRYQKKDFQISLFPGIGSNGIYSGWYFNKVSINIFSGLSAGNSWFELGGFTNVSLQNSSGIQIAGLANIVGTSTYQNLTRAQERQQKLDGFTSDFIGIRLAGLLNYSRDQSSGIVLTGGMNINNGSGEGFHLAGLANMTGESYIGTQVAGLYNIGLDGVNGGQISLLLNHTKGLLNGLQLGAINKSSWMKGKHSIQKTKARGLQIGLINISKKVDGTQIGLINFGKQVRGYQIGLINFFRTAPPNEYGPYTTPIGLLNLGSKGGHLRVSTTELFLMESEFTTGSCYNCSKTELEMPHNQKFKKFRQNALIFATQSLNNQFKWGIGYGYRNMLYKKVSMAKTKKSMSPLKGNHSKFVSYGITMMHLNREKEFDSTLSLLTRLQAGIGQRIFGFYVYGGVSLNGYFSKHQDMNRGFEWYLNPSQTSSVSVWPGYMIGTQFKI